MDARGRAQALLAVFGVAIVLGALFPVLTEMDVQTAGSKELAARHSDAVAFFTFDYLFIVVYAVAGAHALWRFGTTLAKPGAGSARVPPWLAVGVVALVAGGALDAIENALLLASSSSGAAEPVRIAHLLAIPKWAFGGIGFVMAVAAAVAAVRLLRRPEAA